jgi:hypothetical protein
MWIKNVLEGSKIINWIFHTCPYKSRPESEESWTGVQRPTLLKKETANVKPRRQEKLKILFSSLLSSSPTILRVKETSKNHGPLWSNDRDNWWGYPVWYGKHCVDNGKTSKSIRNETWILLSYALDYRLLSLKRTNI